MIASTSTGAGIQGNPVCLPVTAQPGHSYPLGTVYVVNTGSGQESLSVHVAPVWAGQGGNPRDVAVPASWISVSYPKHDLFLSSSSVSLPAGQGTYLAVTVTIPAGARPGMYVGNLVASAGTSSPQDHTAALGAAAATGLELGVGVHAPSCGIPAPSAAAVAEAQHAAAAGDMVPAATATTAKTPYAGWAILILLGMIVLAGLRRLMR
jgi:hypothetical protein